jgi:nitrate reductase gamma subunit
MTVLVYTAVAIGSLVFVIASAARALLYARSPMHLRWELYPVPHEHPDRVPHGGSYFEEGEWWNRPRVRRVRGELAVMVPEILFLKALREHNPGLWRRSFPFHVGLYLLAGAGTGLIGLAAVSRLAGAAWLAGAAAHVVRWTVTGTGWAGIVLAVSGALALLHRRIQDPALRSFTTPGDVFNLLFFAGALGTLGAGYVARPPGSADALGIAIGLLSWTSSVQVPRVLAAGLVATAALAAYIPLTHMSHFIGKYFTYHAVRWDDAPFGDSRRMSVALAASLAQRPTWAAGHMKADGRSTWTDVVTTNPTDEAGR